MASSGPEKADCPQIISSTSPGGVPGVSGGSSTRPTLKITLLGSEWNSSAGGLSTFNRELAIHLSEHPEVDVTLLVPEGACKYEEKNEARRYGVNVVDAKCQAGLDPLYWLSCPPKDLHIDIVIGHGMKLGPQVQIIRNCVQFSTCKWVQVVHTAPEDLSKFKTYSDPTSKGETKHQVEVDLCKRADLVVPVGPRLTKSYSAYLRRWKKDKDIFSFTPGLFEREFGDLEQVANINNEDFKVLIVGRGDREDFELKGLDIAAKAFADKRLKHKGYELTFVGAPEGKQEEVRERLLRCGIAKEQLTVRRFVQSRDRLKDLLCEADLAIMPSKSEGFGLVAVEALSAGLPILVGSRSGFAKALEVVVHGHSCVVHSDDPAKWAEAIEAVRDRHRMRLKEIQAVKASYGEMYSWKAQCEALVERMWQIVPGNENRNIAKCKTPVEKHDAASKTSEKRGHSVDEKRKTLGTNKAESSPWKEPPEDFFRPSHLESTSVPGTSFPSTWAPMPRPDMEVHTVTLAPVSSEYQSVLSKVQATARGMHIQKIERIQNPHLYKQYMVRKQKMDKDDGGNNERQLFHGTDARNISAINKHGFNMRFFGAHGTKYGRGLFFARDASCSAGYGGSGIGGGCMYLCRVLVGKYCAGNSSMIVPPPEDRYRPEILYDSVVDNPANPSIFVIFFLTQCYPEYLITF